MKSLIGRLMKRWRRPRKTPGLPVVIRKCPNHRAWIGPAEHPGWLTVSLSSMFLPPKQVSILDMPDEMFLQLEAMRQETGLPCICEVFNQALNLHGWAQQQIATGNVVASIDHGAASYKELAMPWMEAVRRNRQLT